MYPLQIIVDMKIRPAFKYWFVPTYPHNQNANVQTQEAISHFQKTHRGNNLIKMHVFWEPSKVILMLTCARGVSGDTVIEWQLLYL